MTQRISVITAALLFSTSALAANYKSVTTTGLDEQQCLKVSDENTIASQPCLELDASTFDSLQDALDYASENQLQVVNLGAPSASVCDADLNIPDGIALDLGGGQAVAKANDHDYTLAGGLTGVLAWCPAYSIIFGSNAILRNGNVVATGGPYSPATFVPSTVRDGLNVVAAQSGTALRMSSKGARVENVTILGADLCISSTAQQQKILDTACDGRSGVRFSGAAQSNQVSRLTVTALQTSGLDRSYNLLWLKKDSASNAYEITLDENANQLTLAIGDNLHVVPPTDGAQSAAGPWLISNPVARANGEKGCNRQNGCPGGILANSSAVATTLTGVSWSASADSAGDYFILAAANSFPLVAKRQHISDLAGCIQSGTTVKDLNDSWGRIYLSQAPKTEAQQAGCGTVSNGTVTFTDDTWTAGGTAFIAVGERTGPAIECVGASGIKITDSIAYSHDTEVHFGEDCRNVRVAGLTTGLNESGLDDSQTAILIDGNHTGDDADSITITGSNLGQHAQRAVVVDSDSSKCNFISESSLAPGTARTTGTALDVSRSGCVQASNISTGTLAANIFVSDGTKVRISNLTNALSDLYLQTSPGSSFQGVNNVCAVPAVCNYQPIVNFGSLTINGKNGYTPLYNSSGTLQDNQHLVTGSATLSGGTANVTLSGMSAFSGTSNYNCALNDQTAANPTKLTKTSGGSFTITGTGTDVIGYQCVGN